MPRLMMAKTTEDQMPRNDCQVTLFCTNDATSRCRVNARGMIGSPILACADHADMLLAEAEAHGNTLDVQPIVAAAAGAGAGQLQLVAMAMVAALALAVIGCGDDAPGIPPQSTIAPAVVGPGPTPVADDASVLVPLDGFTLNPGGRQDLVDFDAAEGTQVHFISIGQTQPVRVGVQYIGTEPAGKHTYAWLVDYDPYAGDTPKPLAAGRYRVTIGCADEAALPCIFALKVWTTAS